VKLDRAFCIALPALERGTERAFLTVPACWRRWLALLPSSVPTFSLWHADVRPALRGIAPVCEAAGRCSAAGKRRPAAACAAERLKGWRQFSAVTRLTAITAAVACEHSSGSVTGDSALYLRRRTVLRRIFPDRTNIAGWHPTSHAYHLLPPAKRGCSASVAPADLLPSSCTILTKHPAWNSDVHTLGLHTLCGLCLRTVSYAILVLLHTSTTRFAQETGTVRCLARLFATRKVRLAAPGAGVNTYAVPWFVARWQPEYLP